MAIVRTYTKAGTLRDGETIQRHLAGIGIHYERWEPTRPVPADAPAEEILRAYGSEIERLKADGGYVTADVIDVNAGTPNLDQMLAKFNQEHWHDDDEVRFIIQGRGLFHIHTQPNQVTAIEVEAGDLIRVPKGTWHWFDLCGDRRIRAIRLFQDPAGWAPRYTESGVNENYQPVCFGPAYVPPQSS
jgi:1,2-dihydroxy-3-keto-5-methylthiopentene dioxygenase